MEYRYQNQINYTFTYIMQMIRLYPGMHIILRMYLLFTCLCFMKKVMVWCTVPYHQKKPYIYIA